jgi:hypothetical protein
MKITVEISDALLRDAKRIAAREGITVRSLIEQGLRRAVMKRRRSGEFRLRRATFKGEGLTLEASRLGWDRLRELAYGDRGA